MRYTDSTCLGSRDSERPRVEVAVTVIRRGQVVLAGFNTNWDCYTLPMTKRRYWPSSEEPGKFDAEPWEAAAGRSVLEWLPGADGAPPRPLMQVAAYRQSDRDLVVKDFHFEIFATDVEEGQQLRPGARAEWLSEEDFRDQLRRPVSPTARYLVETLHQAGKWL